jgi:predicted ABC-class ATPase
LRDELRYIDGRGYKAYRSIEGAYDLVDYWLRIDHVQSDPFAAPSRVRVRLPRAYHRFDPWCWENRSRRIAFCDYLTRAFRRVVGSRGRRRAGSGASGAIDMVRVGQEVLERSSVTMDGDTLEARFTVGLPAQGRRILGRRAALLLLEDVPRLVESSLRAGAHDLQRLRRFVEVCEDQDVLRERLAERGLVAFVGNGAVLPRLSGVDDRPLAEGAVRFRSPETLEVAISVPHQGELRGMGVPRGVTLIVGGGYHGKSTLLRALERGVYDHVPGDGREHVVTNARAVKIRAEDGRRVCAVDISPFIHELPGGRRTRAFRTDNASGSTSQAANIIEALELGAELLLIDEDTCATNFMIRDHRVQALVPKSKEPITPFIDKVRDLYVEHGVSTILVVGGAGDYFDVADTVIMMDNYVPRDVTERARAIARELPTGRVQEGGPGFGPICARAPDPRTFSARRGRREVKIDTKGLTVLRYGQETIDLWGLEQLVDQGQTRAIGQAIHYLVTRIVAPGVSLREALERLEERLDRRGLLELSPYQDGALARPRLFEIGAAINRMRSVEIDLLGSSAPAASGSVGNPGDGSGG